MSKLMSVGSYGIRLLNIILFQFIYGLLHVASMGESECSANVLHTRLALSSGEKECACWDSVRNTEASVSARIRV